MIFNLRYDTISYSDAANKSKKEKQKEQMEKYKADSQSRKEQALKKQEEQLKKYKEEFDFASMNQGPSLYKYRT